MKKRNRKFLFAMPLLLVVIGAVLSSFSEKIGGESFEIYLGNKQVIHQFVTRDAVVKTLQLNESNNSEVLSVHYNHCGKTGVGRSISIRNAEDKTLKTWHFPDAVGDASSFMTCNAKDIIALQKSNAGKPLNLVYSSKEIPKGKVLAALAYGDNDRASIK